MVVRLITSIMVFNDFVSKFCLIFICVFYKTPNWATLTEKLAAIVLFCFPLFFHFLTVGLAIAWMKDYSVRLGYFSNLQSNLEIIWSSFKLIALCSLDYLEEWNSHTFHYEEETIDWSRCLLPTKVRPCFNCYIYGLCPSSSLSTTLVSEGYDICPLSLSYQQLFTIGIGQ